MKVKGRYGFIDKKGNLVIEPKYRRVLTFSEGLAGVDVKEHQWGFINKNGEIVIKPE